MSIALPAVSRTATATTAATEVAAPTAAIGLAKRSMNEAEEAALAESLAYEAALQEVAGRTADHAEGLAAFAEKRDPRFTGS